MKGLSEITERDIQIGIYGHIYLNGWRWFLPNVYFFKWETDYLAFNDKGMIHEFEIKQTRQDYLKDYGKQKHAAFRAGPNHPERIPNFFTFVLPPGIATRYEIPSYAGVMVWRVERGQVRVKTVRQPQQLTQAKAGEGDFEYLVEKSNLKMIKAWAGQG